MLADIPTTISDSFFQTRRAIMVLSHLGRLGNLPTELVRMIAFYLSNRTIFTISLLSKGLRCLANSYIYSVVTIDFSEFQRSGSAAVLLLRTLLTNESIASCVDAIRLIGDPLGFWRESMRKRDQIEDVLRELEPPTLWLSLASMEADEREMLSPHCFGLKKEREKIAGWTSASNSSELDPQTSKRGFGLNIIKMARRIKHLRFSSKSRTSLPPLPTSSLQSQNSQPEPQISSLEARASRIEPRITWTEFCTCILTVPRKFTSLDITSDYFRSRAFRVSFAELMRSAELPNLTNMSLCPDLAYAPDRHLKAVQHWDDALMTALFTSLSASVVMSLKPNVVPLLRLSTLQYLNLDHCQTDRFDLNQLFIATPMLEYLDYYAWVDYDYYITSTKAPDRRSTLGLQPLFSALTHVKETLTHLKTAVDFTEDRKYHRNGYEVFDGPPFGQIHGIAQLKKLRRLSVPYALLLGGVQRENPVGDWESILPNSLRTIAWTDYASFSGSDDDWTDEGLMPVIVSLLTWLAKRDNEDPTPAEFSLRLFDFQTKFNEPVRLVLTQLCRSLGIDCVFSKLRTTLLENSWVYMLEDLEDDDIPKGFRHTANRS